MNNPPAPGSIAPLKASVGNQSILCMRDVTKAYGKKTVLDHLELDVPAGTVLGLLGKNGAGKTTLIKCALGLARPQSGQITLLGEPAWELSGPTKARLGYVPQTVQLYPWMKVRQVIAYTAAFYPRWNQELIDRLLREWELPAEDCVGPLSVGQLQKLAILLALGHEPEVLVLDEPAASLDPAARRNFLRTVLDIAAEGKRTVLFSTHITSDLERVADSVAILKSGRIIYHGELDELKDQVKRLHVIAPRALTGEITGALRGALPGVLGNGAGGGGEILHQQVRGNEATLSVRRLQPGMVEALRTRLEATVEVEDLNLEDIFLELHEETVEKAI